MRRSLFMLALLPLLACGQADRPAGPPEVREAAYSADAQPYDPALDARAAVDAALSKAGDEGKLVLVSMGGNWCPDCRILSGMMEIDAMSAMIDDAFEVVKVDVGEPLPQGGYEKNQDLAARLGAAGFEGVPTLLILTPGGELLNADEPSIFRNARDRNPQDLADYLYRYASQARTG